MKCVSCGNELPAESPFCNQCGAPQTIACKSCGNSNPPGSRFCAKCGSKLADSAATSAADPPPVPVLPVTRSAERRHVNVMFCDLVGSTALSGRLDPEDLSDVISAYQKCVATVVQRFDGFIAKYMGDGVLIYFGYPEAHEDDGERAVRSALNLVDSVGHLDTLAGTLQLRIGIATGLVVVGDLIGQGEAQERGIVGETPNLAARLQALAKPNDIVICPSTRRLVKDLFEYEKLGAVELKGFPEPVIAFGVVRETTVESRFEALHAGQTPIVGREEELDLLRRRWRQAKEGEGRVVLISGEPGIGKSRLTAALQEHLKDEPHFGVRYFCSPHHQGSALQPVVAQLKAAAGFSREDGPEAQIAKLETYLAQTADDVAATAGSYADLLGIVACDRYPLPPSEPQRRRQQLLMALLAQLGRMARRQPVVVTFEDAHWADPTTLELLSLINERVPSWPILVVITFRPEFQSPFVGQPHVAMLALNRLGRRDRMAMVEQVTGGKTLPPGLLDQIIDRTDGVPLFVEELTKALLESAQLRETADGYVLDQPLAPLSIPSSLQASLMARLDRLGSTRDVVQVGAAIGREFSYELLAAVAELPDAGLRTSLTQLTEAELVFQRGTPPNAIFTFKHALVQDAAYSTMLRAKRQQLHARIAQALENHFPDLVRSTPEVVAQHLEKAGKIQLAIRYWRQAGDHALRNSSLKEALAHLSDALRLAETDPDAATSAEQELAICLQLGLVSQMAGGPTSKLARDYYQRAEKLARNMPARGRELFIAIWGIWFFLVQTMQFEAAITRAGELLAIAHDIGDNDLVLEAHHASLPGLHATGQFPAVKIAAQEARRLYERKRHGDHANMFGGHDSGVCARSYQALSLWAFGFFEQASREAHATIAEARTLGHQFSLAHGLLQAALTFLFLRDEAACAAIAAELLPLAEKNKFPWPLAYGQFLTGWVRAHRGEHDAGVVQMMTAAAQPSAGSRRQLMLVLAADVEAQAGRNSAALGILEPARQISIDTGLRVYDAEISRLRGDILLRLSPNNEAEAEACFADALATSRQQSCRALELRTVASLARLRRDQNRSKEARELLAPVCDWFTEGQDVPDLKAAKALLAGLI